MNGLRFGFERGAPHERSKEGHQATVFVHEQPFGHQKHATCSTRAIEETKDFKSAHKCVRNRAPYLYANTIEQEYEYKVRVCKKCLLT